MSKTNAPNFFTRLKLAVRVELIWLITRLFMAAGASILLLIVGAIWFYVEPNLPS